MPRAYATVQQATPQESAAGVSYSGLAVAGARWEETDRCTSLAQRTRAGRRRRGRRRCRSSGRGRKASTGRGALGSAAGIVSDGSATPGLLCLSQVQRNVTHPLQLVRLRSDGAERCRLFVWGIHCGGICGKLVRESMPVRGLCGRLDGSMGERVRRSRARWRGEGVLLEIKSGRARCASGDLGWARKT